MFSASDIQDIFRALPPEKGTDGQIGDLPALLSSTTGQGFVTTEYAFGKFKHILTTAELKQISIAGISQELDIESDTVLRFARASPALTSLTRENANIIPTKQREFLQHQLEKQLTQGLVSKEDFSREHNISLESLDTLVQSNTLSQSIQNGNADMDGYIAGKSYQHLLADSIKRRLDEALEGMATAELSSGSCPGSPPIWYLSQTVHSVLKEFNMESDFHVNQDNTSIVCTPKASVQQNRNAEVDRLSKGDIPCLDVQKLFEDFQEIYTSKESVEENLATYPNIELLEGTAISNAWLSKFGTQCAEALKILGYADLTSNIKASFPPATHDRLIQRLEKHIISAYSESELHRAGDYLLTPARYDTDRELLLHSASLHASQRWKDLKEDAAKELKFDPSEAINFIPEDQNVLRSIAEDTVMKKVVEEKYWNEISALEATNETEFSRFWIDRVVSRTSNYVKGLEAIEDPKLNSQLAELLSSYVAKELLPDSIAKARERGLLKSRKTTKSIQKLETSLHKRGDPTAALPALDKFNTKQGIPELDIDSLQEAKQSLVEDMMNRIQKAKDPPTLFLLLIIVLLAKQFSGIVYATGKFAPKLMKLLKPSLSEEQYGELEKWKDAAKAGTLTSEDKSGMRALAGEGN